MTIDSKTLDEWEQRANAMIGYIALADGDPCDSPYPDMKKLIEEVRRLLTESREFREALNFYSMQTKMCSHGVIEYDIGTKAREVLAKFPEDK